MKRHERINIVIQRVDADTIPNSIEEAWDTLNKHLKEVEDEFSGQPYEPHRYGQDGNKRMYLPTLGSGIYSDFESNTKTINLLACQLYLSNGGAIRIDVIDTKDVLINKPGANGEYAQP